jgi:hypothetical protein
MSWLNTRHRLASFRLSLGTRGWAANDGTPARLGLCLFSVNISLGADVWALLDAEKALLAPMKWSYILPGVCLAKGG